MSTKNSRLAIEWTARKHKQLKRIASDMGMTMKDYVIMTLESSIDRKPNEVTEKAIRQAQSGKGLKKFSKIEDLFDDLGI